MLPQYRKDFIKIPKVLIYFLAFHHHIIDVGLHIFAQLALEHPRYHPLVCGSSILQPEGHYLVMIVSHWGEKSCFLLV